MNPALLKAVLALDVSALNIESIEEFIKFSQIMQEMKLKNAFDGIFSADVMIYNKMREEIESKNYDIKFLNLLWRFCMYLSSLPRIEAKLRLLGFKITFDSQVEDLTCYLNTMKAAIKEVEESTKLQQIMQIISKQGEEGSKMDKILKLSYSNLMPDLCKFVSENMPELLDFPNDLVHLETASQIKKKMVVEKMKAIIKGLDIMEQELVATENDRPIFHGFQKALKEFHETVKGEVRLLCSLQEEVGSSAKSLFEYFAEDPARCSFEQVTTILTLFIKSFIKSRDQNETNSKLKRNSDPKMSTLTVS